jgi:acyl-CoA reductase-like NAD-dependent aldehyde dehydrogenase
MTKPMKLGGCFTFPNTSIVVHRMGYGAMQLAGPGVWGPPRNIAEALDVLREATAAGVNHIDTGDFYGPPGFEAGYFVKPTIFVNVKNNMTIAQEEIFGPVLCVITYDSEDEAIRIANDSKYGLHSAVLGTDLKRARRVASQIRAGRVVINGMTDDPQAPWGGFKYSGFGREYGQYGAEAFLETRAILES